MRVKIEMSEDEIRSALSDHISSRYGIRIAPKDLDLMVKSTQNYKSEWEKAAIKLQCEATPRN